MDCFRAVGFVGLFSRSFYQYFRSIPDKGFWTAYERQMEKLTARMTFRRFKRVFKTSRAEKGYTYDFKIQDTSFPMKFPQYWSVKLQVNIGRTKTGDVSALGDSHEQDFTGLELLGIKTRAVAHVLLSTQVATEYFLPFLLALLPLVNFLRTLRWF